MDLSLDESQQILVDTFSEMLEKECPTTHVRDCEETGFSSVLWNQYCELGANIMGLPEANEGLEMSLLDLGLVHGRNSSCPGYSSAARGRNGNGHCAAGADPDERPRGPTVSDMSSARMQRQVDLHNHAAARITMRNTMLYHIRAQSILRCGCAALLWHGLLQCDRSGLW